LFAIATLSGKTKFIRFAVFHAKKTLASGFLSFIIFYRKLNQKVQSLDGKNTL
jgi:hypothetical protein